MENKLFCIAVVFAALSVLSSYFFRDKQPTVVIGILSAQNNTAARKAVRDSWIKLIKSDPSIEYFFIVGDTICPLHPSDRVDPWSCKLWEVSVPNGAYLWTGKKRKCFYVNSDFFFSVRTSVIITGIEFSCAQFFFRYKHHDIMCRAEILDALTGQTLSSATAHGFGGSKSLHPPLLLPTGYEAHIRVFIKFTNGSLMFVEDTPDISENGYSWDGAGRILTLLETDNIEDCIAARLFLAPEDLPLLKSHVAGFQIRQAEYNREMLVLQERLAWETDHHKDIAFVQVVDTYHNLTSKLLAFLEWLQTYVGHNPPKFLLKTDDDVFLDAARVVQNLESCSESLNLWWGTFRKDWPMQRIGKWREPSALHSDVYPTFPCGAGYVLSWDLVIRLLQESRQKHTWKPQGEDVSIGVWLKGMNPRELYGSCSWDCPPATGMQSPLCNKGEQTPNSMIKLWDQYLTLGHIPD